MRKETKMALIALPTIFLSNLIIGVVFGVGLKHNFFNTIHHYLGGVFVALFFYGYLYEEVVSLTNISWIKKWFIIIAATAFVGMVWEFAEWIGSYHDFDYLAIGDLNDTLLDLVVDSFGAVTLLLLHPVRKRNPK